MLLAAHQKLLADGRPNATVSPTSPIDALMQLLYFAEDGNTLACAHPWSLDPAVCRRLEDATGSAPPGGWARLAALAVGANVLNALTDRFVPAVASAQLPLLVGDGAAAMVEAFTRRLTPPSAAAALYVSLDVHPLWGLEIGRYVGSCDGPSRTPGAVDTFPQVRDFVFGTIAGFVTSLRSLAAAHRYPIDQLGEVLFQCAQASRALAGIEARHSGVPVLLDNAPAARRQLTTRLAAQDLLDSVLVPAGVCRRDDSDGFSIDPTALGSVTVGDWGLDERVAWWNAALTLEHRAAC